MSAEDFDTTLGEERGSQRAGDDRRRRGLRGPARSAAGAGAAAEGRPRQDFDPGAGRPVSHLHRGGAATAPRARRRLSGDGGLARLSQIAPAAAGAGAGRRPERRGHGAGAGLSAAAAGSLPRSGGQADGAAAAQPRRLRARRCRSRSPRSSSRNGRRRFTICSAPMRSSAAHRRCRACASRSARCGRSPKRATRWSG